MRTKSAYREKSENIPAAEIPAPNIPEIKIDDRRVEPVATISAQVPDNAAAAEAASDPTLALTRQIEELRKSEALQHQHAATMAQAQRPKSREEKLNEWRRGGLSDAEANFLQSNVELIDNDRLTALAANEAAQQGHERGTEAHMQATKQIFHQHLQAAANPAPTARPTSAFFDPPPPPEASTPSPASFTSAPVSREVPSGYREPTPSAVRLSLEEKEHAKLSGISEVEYAKNKLRMLKERASGVRQ